MGSVSAVVVAGDGKSLLEGPWDAFSSAVFNAYDAYGCILPALLLTTLLLGVLVLISCAIEDLRIDADMFNGIGLWAVTGWF